MIKYLLCTIISLAGFTSILSANEGETLFKANCTACHSIGKGKLTGPDLLGVVKRHDDKWLLSWITSSQTLIKSGDEAAVKLFKENNEFPMPDAPISSDDIKKVIEYLHTVQDGSKPAVALPTGVGLHGTKVANPLTHFTLQQDHGNLINSWGFSWFIIFLVFLLLSIVAFALFLWGKARMEARHFQ